MSVASSIAYDYAASQVLAKMHELEQHADRWAKLSQWVDKEL